MGEQGAVPKGKIISAVASDMIWKDYVRKATKTQIEVWPNRWSWIIDENEKMYDAMAGKRPLSPYNWTEWDHPQNLDKENKAPAKSDYRYLGPKLPPLSDMTCRPNVPQTSSGWYGLLPKINGQSVVSDRQKWCKVTVGQHNLPRVFGWPDAFD